MILMIAILRVILMIILLNNLFQWFRNNHMKTNADKCHLLVTGNYEVSANINEFEIESSKKEKLLGISIDTTLSFEHHITSFVKKLVKSCMCCSCSQ